MDRNITNKINFILDNWVPPILRDCDFIMRIVLRLVFGKKYHYYMDFKKRLPILKESDINRYYFRLADTFIKRETDLNKTCMNRILNEVSGEVILDAAAGRGYLAGKIYEKHPEMKITVSDIVLQKNLELIDGIRYVEATLTQMPFSDNTFDTVICTHALEHIKDVQKALSELRRICKKTLIIVIPRQREYLYTFDLHINFFPYKYNVEQMLQSNAIVELIDNDWLCIEYRGG